MKRNGILGVTILIVLSSIAAMWQPAQAAQPSGGVPVSRITRLTRGANVSRWFWQATQTADYFTNYITDADIQLMKSLGIRFVRLNISPLYVYDPQHPGTVKTTVLPYIDKAVNRFLANDIAVIIDIHNADDPEVALLNLEGSSTAGVDYSAFWGALAQHFNTYNPEMIFFEIVNEPQFESNPSKWYPIQTQVAKAIRAAAPSHTIIASGTNWSTIDAMVQMTPLADTNVIYTFHFYEPLVFTHQGADWVMPGFETMKNVPYPSNSSQCNSVLSTISKSTEGYGLLSTYCGEQWNASTITARIKVASDWSKKNNVPLLLGEFGVYPPNSPAQNRLQWLTDVRTAVENVGIGWTIWAYDDEFGLNRMLNNQKITIDQNAAQALGLNTSGSIPSPTATPVLPTPTPKAFLTPTPLKPGDANGDGKVDGIDYVIWLNNYGTSNQGLASGNFNGDSKVDGVDYVIWLTNFGH